MLLREFAFPLALYHLHHTIRLQAFFHILSFASFDFFAKMSQIIYCSRQLTDKYFLLSSLSLYYESNAYSRLHREKRLHPNESFCKKELDPLFPGSIRARHFYVIGMLLQYIVLGKRSLVSLCSSK